MSFFVYSWRIFHDRIKMLFVFGLLLIPLLDFGQILYELYTLPESSMPDPRYVAFSALYTVGTNHMLHKVMFWFLPIYLLIITGEDSFEDQDTGYGVPLQCRMSRKQYIYGKGINAFLFSFLLIFASLMLNYLILQIAFHEGNYIWIASGNYPAEERRLYTIGYTHPVLVNMINIMLTAVLSGMIGMIGNLLAINFGNRKIVYGITFMLWFIFVLIDDGLMSLLHPFTTMTLENFTKGVLIMEIGYLAIGAVALISEVKLDEI